MKPLPGFRDFYPEPVPHPDAWSAETRNFIFEKWRAVARRYNFLEYDGPPLEPLELYTVKSGEEIVGQLYNFIDKGDRAVALRPEMTPTLARLAAAHERNYRKPLKWFAIPQLFRYERQQKGRLREHFQFNADLLGETDPAADAELVALLIDILRELGLGAEDIVVRLSSRQAWHEFLQRHQPDPAQEYGFYQIIDKLEREDPQTSDERLRQLGLSLSQVQEFIQSGQPTTELASIIDNLKARGMGDLVRVDYNVIRGLAYYTGTVFEAFDRKGIFRAIAGGGRYDHLVELISGGRVKLSAIGFGMGDVVLTELLRERSRLPAARQVVDLFFLVEDEAWRPETLRHVTQLRRAGLTIEYSLTPSKSEKQFKRALDIQARFTARLEKNEAGETQARLKNLQTREELTVPAADLEARLALLTRGA
jgi:histidyl-tRNA synthetase